MHSVRWLLPQFQTCLVGRTTLQMDPQSSADAARRADADADPAQAITYANERRGSSDAALGRAKRRSTRERISGLSTDMLVLDEDSLTSPLRASATRIPASCATFLSAEERGASRSVAVVRRVVRRVVRP